MAGLKSLFNFARIQNVIDGFVDEKQDGMIAAMEFSGEEFVNNARDQKTYRDRTANLRSSIGYGVYVKGKRTSLNTEGTGTGRGASIDTIQENVTGADIELIGAAGMEYAAAVEAKGFDVITGSVPSRKKILKNIDEINN